MRTALAVLALLILTAGCGTIEVKISPPMIPGQPTPGVLPDNANAPSQAQPEPAPATETKAAPQPTQERRTQQRRAKPAQGEKTTAMFRHFNVRIMRVTQSPDYYAVNAEVCLVDELKGKPTRVSTAPWTVRSDGHTIKPVKFREDLGTVGTFPRETWLTQDECAHGWLSFPAEGTDRFKIIYHNSLGDRAVWNDSGTRV
jgi:hypothetical protein